MNDQEYVFIKYKVRHLLGIDLNAYKSAQMQRRLQTYLLRSGQPNWPRFFRTIQDDPVQLTRFKDYLTINVSTFFRDPEKFTYLRANILPALLRHRPRLRLWSAGCSAGYEAYSLAIELAEAGGFYHRHTILATDIDTSALARARAGGPYPEDKLEHVRPTQRQRYFEACENGFCVQTALKRPINFRHHNLLIDEFEEDLDLIVCRNVIIYFSQEVKQRLYHQFWEALREGGVLFVGSTEVITQAASLGFEPVGISFYRKVG